ncbi:GNAT family N-acetyltransferase [Clostridium sp. MT-14]|jgi:GNAT superfamily N-acetyltransferase|uniref:GNAT family N-acetyltransferase n=1 Tax=Clostridium aromativorans TaxID=2836848 RepID=A0ABS8N9A6_9CLOT|nr:GNAT family N-acetyltransferase [Clostridium aromativorans]MCC9296415.1 GNAT family N-acetyltransferase [Clostridium aromativorans]
MDFSYKNGISVDDYNRLRDAVGWDTLNKEQAQAGINRSRMVVSCYEKNKIIGSARILWDGGYIAYLADVMVLPSHQGFGIGKKMVGELILFLKSQLKSEWKIKIVLISAKGKEPFYEKLGFIKRPNENDGAGMNMWIKYDE